MLFMDLGSDVLPSISIAYDDAELGKKIKKIQENKYN